MAKSSKKIAEQLVTERLLDMLGDDRKNYSDLKQFPVLKKLIELAALEFIQTATEVLDQQGKRNTGGLIDDLSKTDVTEDYDGYEVTLGYDKGDPAAKYFNFVNKGVSGYENKRSGTEYSFEDKRNKKGGILISKSMYSAILLWYRNRRNMAMREDQKTKRNKAQKKNLKALAAVNQAKSLQGLVYGTAVNIKKKGIRASRFFDRAAELQFGDGFNEAVAKAVAGDLRVYIRQFNSLINNDNNKKN